MMDEPTKPDQIDEMSSPSEQAIKNDDKQDNKQANKPYNKTSVNGLNKLSTAKTLPLILKRGRLNEKVDCSESNENIDENKDRKDNELKPADVKKELVQRSSSRKKFKKNFGNDFLHLDSKQFYSNSSSSARYSASSTATTASTTTASTKKSRAKDCTYCSKNNGELNFCRSCRLRAHQKCFQNNFGIMREGYKNKVVICGQCRNCEMCEDKKGEIFFCKRCSSCFHLQCDANLIKLSKPQLGKWQCSFCDTLDGLVGDTLTEEARRKEINRRKLLVMRKRLRKSDYVLEDGLCSIQQCMAKQAVKKRKKDNQSNQDDKNEIDLSEDELINSKHILNESQNLEIWTDDESIDFNKLEDFLKRERKLNNILSKHIKDDKNYFELVKVFIDQLKDEKFNSKKSNFLKLLNSDFFKKSFFESNSLNGLTKSSTFLEACTKCFEKCIQNDYWKCPTESEPDCFDVVKETESKMIVEEAKSNKESLEKDVLELECEEEFSVNESTAETDLGIKNESGNSKELIIANEDKSSEQNTRMEIEIDDKVETSVVKDNEMEVEVDEVKNENALDDCDQADRLVIDEKNEETEKIDDNEKITNSTNDESLNNETNDLICEETIDDNIDEEKSNLNETNNLVPVINSKEAKVLDKDELTNKLNNIINQQSEQSASPTKKSKRSKSTTPKSVSPQPSTSKESDSLAKSNGTHLDIKPSSNNLADKLFKAACKYNLNLLEPRLWTTQDVSTYIKQIGFDNAAECFKEKSIDGETLLNLTRQEVLNNFNIKLGPAVKLYAYIYDIQVKNRCNIIFK